MSSDPAIPDQENWILRSQLDNDYFISWPSITLAVRESGLQIEPRLILMRENYLLEMGM